MKATNENLPPNVIKQLAKELKNLDENPPEGIKVCVNDDDFSTIFADVDGPAGTPYENGIFRMKLLLSHDFPHSPPKGAVVRCLLIEPFPESALNEQAGKMLLENYEEYAKHARLYTGIHALKPKPKTKLGAISESTTTLNVDQMNLMPSTAPVPTVPLSNKGAGGGISGQDQPISTTATLVTTTVQATTMVQPKKGDATASAKVQVDRKKMDARKKSLKRL
ncbi:Ubiquitin-conjugating enzyme E2 22 [Asimina triloba]